MARYPRRGRSPPFDPVVVKLSSDRRLPKLLLPSYLYALECVEEAFSEVRLDGILVSPPKEF